MTMDDATGKIMHICQAHESVNLLFVHFDSSENAEKNLFFVSLEGRPPIEDKIY